MEDVPTSECAASQSTKQITKNQHFIPQVLLRGFANKVKDAYKVVVFDLKRKQVRKNQRVENVGAENYLYDKDNVVENFLAENVEAPASAVFKKILSSPEKFHGPIPLEMLRFICVQLNRTPAAYEHVTKFRNSFASSIFEKIADFNELDVVAAGRLKLVPNDPRSLMAHQTLDGVLNWPLIKDLAWHLVINNSIDDFVVGDAPVFLYNWYTRKSKDPRATSLNKRCVQIFLPLSSRVLLCLFDSDTYYYGRNASEFTTTADVKTIRLLNSFQVLNADSFVYFRSENMADSIRGLALEYGPRSTFSVQSSMSDLVAINDQQLKSNQITWRSQTVLKAMPSFIKTKTRLRKKAGFDWEDRCPDMVAAVTLRKSDERHRRKASEDVKPT